MNDKRPFITTVQEGRHGKYFVTDSGRQIITSRTGIENYPVGTQLILKPDGRSYRVLQAYPTTATTA